MFFIRVFEKKKCKSQSFTASQSGHSHVFFFFFLAKVTPVDVKSNHVQDLFDQIFMLVRLNDAEQRKYKGKKVGFSFDVLL